MTSKTHFACLMASLVVLCTAAPVLFAQDAQAAGPPVKGTETTSKCPVMAEMKDSTLKPTAGRELQRGLVARSVELEDTRPKFVIGHADGQEIYQL